MLFYCLGGILWYYLFYKSKYVPRVISLYGLLLIAMLSGCTTRAAYDALRIQQEMQCQKLQGADQAECERRTGMSYDEYQRQLSEREKDK